jgi:hypothetical protein
MWWAMLVAGTTQPKDVVLSFVFVLLVVFLVQYS